MGGGRTAWVPTAISALFMCHGRAQICLYGESRLVACRLGKTRGNLIAQQNSGAHECIGKVVVVVVCYAHTQGVRAGPEGFAGMQARFVVLLVADGGILWTCWTHSRTPTHCYSVTSVKSARLAVVHFQKMCAVQGQKECSIICTVFLPAHNQHFNTLTPPTQPPASDQQQLPSLLLSLHTRNELLTTVLAPWSQLQEQHQAAWLHQSKAAELS